MKRLSFFYLLLIAPALLGQVDSNALNEMFDRVSHLSEASKDSIGWYADYANRIYLENHYNKAKTIALSLYGYFYENKGDYGRAIDYYLQTLDEARKQNDIRHQIKALTDLAAVYTQDMNQPKKAKEVYLQCIELNKTLKDSNTLVDSYINLSAIYNRLGLYDSSLGFLREGLRIGQPLEAKGRINLSSLYNNFGNTYYLLKDYEKSLVYFRFNYYRDFAGTALTRLTDLWYDVLNMADSYTEKGAFDSATRYGDSAILLATQMDSKSKQADSYQVLGKLAGRRKDYKKAWEYQTKWFELDTALVNAETYKSIAELEAKYETRERENEKLVLQSEITQQKFHNRVMMIMAASLLLIAIAAAMAFVVKRRSNRQLQTINDHITRQNERLSELNYEKNSLISIVSHDLSTPFATISMWQQLLENEAGSFTPSQKKALDRIGQATHYGEKLIRHILDVEKAETNQRKVQLENLDLRIFTESILDDFAPAADKKNIQLHLECPTRSIWFLSDRQLLARMLENLLSNAIKYTNTGKNVWVSVSEEKDAINIKVRDEGIGIQPGELPHLFSKYSKISSQPTNGESSTGLGLAIVKRICEELNGRIFCESSLGNGSIFTVVLKK